MKTLKVLLPLASFFINAHGMAATGASWANLPSGAREAGLAGGMAALAQGLQGSRLAPSSLARLQGNQGAVSHDQWVLGVSAETLSVAQGLGHGLGAALSAEWVDMGEVVRYQRNASGGMEEAGRWRPSAGALTASLGFPVGDQVAAGVAVRGWRQDLDSDGVMAASASGSLAYQFSPAFSAVASVVDVGSKLGQDDLPSTVRLGAAYHSHLGVRLGLEAALSHQPIDGLDLAGALEAPLGQNLMIRGGGVHLSGSLQLLPTAGLSLNVGSMAVDLAYRPVATLGSTLQAGLSWKLP